jgi:hypothetical protein
MRVERFIVSFVLEILNRIKIFIGIRGSMRFGAHLRVSINKKTLDDCG